MLTDASGIPATLPFSAVLEVRPEDLVSAQSSSQPGWTEADLASLADFPRALAAGEFEEIRLDDRLVLLRPRIQEGTSAAHSRSASHPNPLSPPVVVRTDTVAEAGGTHTALGGGLPA